LSAEPVELETTARPGSDVSRGGAPRRRRTMIAAVVLLVLAAQAWVGALMMFDGSDGAAPLWRFRPPTIQQAD